jgi:hypothetical protein
MKRPQYFAAKPIEEEHYAVENELLLWRSVLDQAMQDISYLGNDKEYIKFREDAIHWLINDSDDFDLICDFAMLDSEKARQEFFYIVRIANDKRKRYD